MNRKLKNIISLALVMCMLCTSLSTVGLAIDEIPEDGPDEEAELKSLCILGDSISAGYGLEEYEKRAAEAGIYTLIMDEPAVEGCFSQIVSERYGLTPEAHAHSAWRTTEFLRVINGDFEEDWTWSAENMSGFDFENHTPEELSDLLFTSIFMADPEIVKGETENIPKALQDSSIVVVNFGANDIYTYAMLETLAKYGDRIGSLGEIGMDAKNLKENFIKLLNIAVNTTEILTYFNAKAAEGLTSYEKNMPQILDYITNINPDAHIFIISVDNPMKYYLIQNDYVSINALELMSGFADLASFFTQRVCDRRLNCTYVDATDVPYFGLNGVDFSGFGGSDSTYMLSLIKAVHPTEKGHAEIAKKIIRTIEAGKTSPTIKIDIADDRSPTISWDKMDGAIRYRIYRSTNPDSGYKQIFETASTSYTDITRPYSPIDLNPEKTYYYKVAAVMNFNGTIISGDSNVVERPAVFTVTFETNGGSEVAAQKVEKGVAVNQPENPFKEGYTFAGWFADAEFGEDFNFDSFVVTENTTVYAKWTEDSEESGSGEENGSGSGSSSHSKSSSRSKSSSDSESGSRGESGSASGSQADAVSSFIDVNENDWFSGDVDYVCKNGLMKGTSSSFFEPNASTTRGMIVTVLYRLEGEPAVSGGCPFGDVAPGSYYEKAIIWAAENGIVKGYSADKFGPDDNITREQMAAIFYRYAQTKGEGFTGSWMFLLNFADAASISEYANEAMHWCVMKELICGTNNNMLDPQGNATRAQVAAILNRFCKLMGL